MSRKGKPEEKGNMQTSDSRYSISGMINKYSHNLNDPLVLNSFYLILNAATSSILGFLFIIQLTHLFPPSDVGIYSVVLSAASLLAMISRLGLDIGVMRFLPESREPNKLIGSCMSVNAILSVALAFIFIVGIPIWSPTLEFISINITFISIFVGLTLLTSVLYLQHNVLISKGMSKRLVIRDIARDGIKIVLVFLIIPLGVMGILGAFLASMLIALVLATLLVRRVDPNYHPALRINRNVVKNIMNYSANNYVAGLLASAPLLILPILVVNLLGAESGAYFFVAWAMAQIIFLVPTAIATSFFAESSKSPEEVRSPSIKALKLALMALAPIIIGTFLFGGYILAIFGKGYSESSTELLWIFTISAIPLAFITIYLDLIRIRMDNRSLLLYSVISASCIVVLCMVGIFQLGLIGAGVGFLSAQIIVALIMFAREGLLGTLFSSHLR